MSGAGVVRDRPVWEADDTEPVLDTTVASILRDAARRSPRHHRPRGRATLPTRARRRRRWTYAELLADAAARAAAPWRRASSPASGWRSIATSIPESLILSYAAALAGVVLVPVNPALRAGELRHVLGQSGAAGAFVVSDYRGHDLGRHARRAPRRPAGVARRRGLRRLGGVLCRGARSGRARRCGGRPGRWRPTTWPSSSTPRGRRGRPRVRCSPIGA